MNEVQENEAVPHPLLQALDLYVSAAEVQQVLRKNDIAVDRATIWRWKKLASRGEPLPRRANIACMILQRRGLGSHSLKVAHSLGPEAFPLLLIHAMQRKSHPSQHALGDGLEIPSIATRQNLSLTLMGCDDSTALETLTRQEVQFALVATRSSVAGCVPVCEITHVPSSSDHPHSGYIHANTQAALWRKQPKGIASEFFTALYEVMGTRRKLLHALEYAHSLDAILEQSGMADKTRRELNDLILETDPRPWQLKPELGLLDVWKADLEKV